MNNLIAPKDLYLFAQLAHMRSFVDVARSEGMSPAFVSKRIAVLENALRVRLFHRTTRNVSLTKEGEAMLLRATRILDEIDFMFDEGANARVSPSGLLRISSSTGFGRNQLAPALAELMQCYPLLNLQLELLDRPVDLIGEGFDLDVQVGRTHEGSLISQHLARNYRILCASPRYLAEYGYPTCLEDLLKHRCLVTRERDIPFGLWRLSGPNGIETIKPTPYLSCNNGEVVHQWALEGHGIFLRSIWNIGDKLRSGELVQVLTDYSYDADVVAIYPHRLEESSRLRICVQFLKKWFSSRDILWSQGL